MALKRRKKKRKHAKVNDDLIDLDKIIKIDSFSLTNNYDPKAVLYILNKKNKLDLTMDDVVFDSFDDHEAKLRAKNTEKYKGRKTIYYEQSRNIGFIIWLIFSLILFFAGIAILLPLGIMWSANEEMHDLGQMLLISSGPVSGGSLVLILICILCWKGEVSIAKMTSVESKVKPIEEEKEKEENSPAIQQLAEKEVEKELP